VRSGFAQIRIGVFRRGALCESRRRAQQCGRRGGKQSAYQPRSHAICLHFNTSRAFITLSPEYPSFRVGRPNALAIGHESARAALQAATMQPCRLFNRAAWQSANVYA
jgi:hypothetical protein